MQEGTDRVGRVYESGYICHAPHVMQPHAPAANPQPDSEKKQLFPFCFITIPFFSDLIFGAKLLANIMPQGSKMKAKARLPPKTQPRAKEYKAKCHPERFVSYKLSTCLFVLFRCNHVLTWHRVDNRFSHSLHSMD